jgi:hypothetical protein
LLSACEPVDRRVRIRERELELGDRARELIKSDRGALAHLWEDPPKQPPVLGNSVESPYHLGANRIVVAGEVEAGYLGALRRRDERLRLQQMLQV